MIMSEPVVSHPDIIGVSPAMVEIFRTMEKASRSMATLLLRGESGTGKGLLARAIHQQSPRGSGPFVTVNCAAIPEGIIESELFGHERGAFTGAVRKRQGRFEQAQGGTIFLDEVGDLPPLMQVKLLRILQERTFERVGSNEPIKADIRVIAATHRDLESGVADGTFREDLYWRLNVVPILLPPLRERKEDLPLLIDYFLSRYNRENQKQVRLSPELRRLMLNYHWPGNIRELQNCIERTVVLAENEPIGLKAIPAPIQGYFHDMKQVTSSRRVGSLKENLENLERERILAALEKSAWVQAKAARLLGITPRQISYKIVKYRLYPPDHLHIEEQSG
jgi:Nif-specific regulatory protein